jgi:hypothetical protein
MPEERLPDPLTPADCNLQDFPFMPVDIGRLFNSEFHARADDAEWRAAVTLWLKSYHQVPAGSVPDDDTALARLAEFGRDIRAWKRVREVALYGWTKCSDGRLYHRIVAAKALEAWIEKLAQRRKSGAGNAKRWGCEFDPLAIDEQIRTALESLKDLDPASRTLLRKHAFLPSGESTRDSERNPSGNPTGTDGDIPQGSQEKGQGQGQGKENPSGSTPPAKPAKPARGSKRVPADFVVTDEMRAWAAKDAPLADIERETEKFRDWEFAHSRTDWPATWRTWMRKASDSKGDGKSAPASRHSGFQTMNYREGVNADGSLV